MDKDLFSPLDDIRKRIGNECDLTIYVTRSHIALKVAWINHKEYGKSISKDMLEDYDDFLSDFIEKAKEFRLTSLTQKFKS